MATSTTITDLKRNFLLDQIRLLSAPLKPGEDWRERRKDDDEDEEDEGEGDGEGEAQGKGEAQGETGRGQGGSGKRRELKEGVVGEVLHKGISPTLLFSL